MTLATRLRERITREGQITFRDWMAAALYDEREGYYCRPDLARWGRAGDYRTSPERTPLFAATFARHFATLYDQLGSPARFTIYETGAGACDFALTTLVTLEQDFPQVFAATRYVVEEFGAATGEAANDAAHAKLARYLDRVEFRPALVKVDERVRECADAPNNEETHSSVGVVFSNELIDALPVHRVVMRRGVLRELCVGLDATENFVWIEQEPTTPRLVEHFARFRVTLAEGQRAEVNLDCGEWIARAASLFARSFVVTVDYGATATELYDPSARFDGTLRAFRRHQLSDDLLAEPGAQDLTATINWPQLERAGREVGLETVSLERQDRFLLRAGALEQLERMCERAEDEAERAALRVGAREMILPGGMSESFQVLVQEKRAAEKD
jgi:SAM-dependent MidA family methyltransferase